MRSPPAEGLRALRGEHWPVVIVLVVAAGDLLLVPLSTLHVAALTYGAVGLAALWWAGTRPWRHPLCRLFAGFWVVLFAVLPLAYLRSPDPLEGRFEITGIVTGGLLALAFVAGTVSASTGDRPRAEPAAVGPAGGRGARRLLGAQDTPGGRGSPDDRGLRLARLGWTIGLAVCCLVALGELVVDRHLWVPDSLAWARSRTIVAGPFRNPNDFAIALCLMVSGAIAYRHGLSGRRRWAVTGLIVLGCCIVVLTESRGGLLALVGVLTVHALRSRPDLLSGSFFGSPSGSLAGARPGVAGRALGIVVVGGVVALAGIVAAFTVPALAARNPLHRLAASLTAEGTARSDHLRLDLIRAGLRYAGESDGWGTGAASFEPLLAADPDPGVAVHTWLHNSFVELLLQYGVLPALLLAALLTALVVTLLRRPRTPGTDRTSLTSRTGRTGRANRAARAARARWTGAADTERTTRTTHATRSTPLLSRARRPAGGAEVGLARAEAAGALIAFVGLGVVASTALPSHLWWLMLAQATVSASLVRAGRSPDPAGASLPEQSPHVSSATETVKVT